MLTTLRHAALAAMLLLALVAGALTAPAGAAPAKRASCAAKHRSSHRRCAARKRHAVRRRHVVKHVTRTVVSRHAAKPKPKTKPAAPAVKTSPAAPTAPPAKTPGATTSSTTTTTTATSPPAPAPARLFSPNSVWNAALPTGAPLDPTSGSVTAALASEARSEFTARKGPWIATTSSSTPIYVVPASQPMVTVLLDTPTATWRAGLAAAFQSVPVPADAAAAIGPDEHMTIWQPSTDRLWEFYHAHKDTAGVWHAAWGGAINHVSSDPGYYTNSSWQNAGNYWGATASSLPVAAGVMRIAELKAGHIDHALALNVPWARSGAYTWPAQRTDGRSTDPNALPEGAHLRLDPKLDISKLNLPPIVREMAIAAQKYGIVVRDQTGYALGFFAEDPAGQGDPYSGPGGFFSNTPPNFLMNQFPWEKLQLLKMDLRSS